MGPGPQRDENISTVGVTPFSVCECVEEAELKGWQKCHLDLKMIKKKNKNQWTAAYIVKIMHLP